MELNEATFTAAIKAAVDKRGKHWVYPINETGWVLYNLTGEFGGGCRYFLESGEPACLIGTALAELGATPEDVTEGLNAGQVLYDLTGEGRDNFNPYSDSTPSWVRAAVAAQEEQDDGLSWGEALNKYLRMVGEN
ncbi:hypothetical protein [Saccharomonospora viridis]|uniref:hypothetical protein n=1 Tax=Saccharomonospora viridis TaxID=1852 RepID=UPI002409F18A|nr:hypothetical protein [Saccharomonospora viridis]